MNHGEASGPSAAQGAGAELLEVTSVHGESDEGSRSLEVLRDSPHCVMAAGITVVSGNTVAFRSKGRDRGAVETHQLAGECSARRLVSFLSIYLLSFLFPLTFISLF